MLEVVKLPALWTVEDLLGETLIEDADLVKLPTALRTVNKLFRRHFGEEELNELGLGHDSRRQLMGLVCAGRKIPRNLQLFANLDGGVVGVLVEALLTVCPILITAKDNSKWMISQLNVHLPEVAHVILNDAVLGAGTRDESRLLIVPSSAAITHFLHQNVHLT